MYTASTEPTLVLLNFKTVSYLPTSKCPQQTKRRNYYYIQRHWIIEQNKLARDEYLQNVLKESKCHRPLFCRKWVKAAALRLYPPVPVNIRAALRTTTLPTGGGPDMKSPILIPKGTSVAYSVYTIHRRPDLYRMDAEIFRVERWDEDMPLNHDETNSKWVIFRLMVGESLPWKRGISSSSASSSWLI